MLPRTCLRAARVAAAPAAPKAVGIRFSHAWLQGKPPRVNQDAGTLAAFYYRAVREFDVPTKDALAAPGQDEKFTHEGLDRHVYGYAVGLIDTLGIKAGSRVGIWLGSEVESLVLQYAVALAGATAVPIDPEASWEAVLQAVGAQQLRVLVVPGRHGAENRTARLAEAFAEELDAAKFSGGTEPLKSKRFRELRWLVTTASEAPAGVVRLRDVPVYGNGGAYDMDVIAAVQTYVQPAQAISVPVSAGGAPGRALTHASALATAAAAAAAVGLGGSDVVALTAPLCTSGGFVAGAMAASSVHAKLVLPSKAFDAAQALAAITQQRATVLVATPAQVAALGAALAADAARGAKSQYDVASLRAGLLLNDSISGPAPAAPMALGGATLKPLSV